MSTQHDSTSAATGKPPKTAKPEKPYPEYPLFAPAAGVWTKKIRDKTHSFGVKLLDKLASGVPLNFCAQPHTCRTVADGAKDQPAVDYLLGHESTHMAAVYRKRITDQRLNAVADTSATGFSPRWWR